MEVIFTLPLEGIAVFPARHGGCESDQCCPWRVWMCLMLPVEGMEVFHNFPGGLGVCKCSTLTMKGVEVFHADRGWMAWKCSMLPM